MEQLPPDLTVSFPRVFYENDYGSGIDIICGSFIYSHMVFPRANENGHRLRYQALAIKTALKELEQKDSKKYPEIMQAVIEDIWVFDVSCGIHASKSWVMGAPIR